MRVLLWRIRRTWGLVRLYWGTEDCDWSVAARLFRYQIIRIRDHVHKHNIVAKADRICRQMSIAADLLDRMIEEKEFDIATARYPESNDRHWAEMVGTIARQQEEMLWTILRKHLRSWWD